MNKATLIERIAAESAVSKKDAENMLDSLVKIIIDELIEDREVTITGFGTFLSRTRHACWANRQARCPAVLNHGLSRKYSLQPAGNL